MSEMKIGRQVDLQRLAAAGSTPAAPATPAAGSFTPLRRDALQAASAARGAAPAVRPLTMDVARLDSQIDAATGTRVSQGNSMELHVDGREAYPRMLETIRSAQHSLHMEMYIFHDDDAGWQVAEALADRAANGVKVRLTTDWQGSPVSSRIFDFMRANGVEVRHHTPGGLNDQITHRKIVIADGARAMTGGMNVGEEYRDTWHDTMVSLQGPVVHDMQRVFLQGWHDAGGSPVAENSDVFGPLPAQPAGNTAMRVVTTYPSDNIRRTVYSAIENAHRNINMEVAYFTDDGLVQRLAAAAQRGVNVNLIIPGVSDVQVVDAAARHHFQQLVDAGVHLHLYEGRTMHTKAMTVDGVWGTIGSANSDNRAYTLEREMNVTFSDPGAVSQLDTRLFGHDFETSRPIERRPTPTLRERVTTWAARLLNPAL